jgi:hypothetical protein
MLELHSVLPPCKRNAVPLPRLSTQSMLFTKRTVRCQNNTKYNTLTVTPTGSFKQLVRIGISSSQRPRQLWGTPSVFTRWVLKALSTGVRRTGFEADNSPASSEKITNLWNSTVSPQYVFIARIAVTRCRPRMLRNYKARSGERSGASQTCAMH